MTKMETQEVETESLNLLYNKLKPEERLGLLYQDFPNNQVLMTSSFGTTSVYLLHLISRINKNQKVYFINTNYHFQETLNYKNQLQDLLGIEIVDLHPDKLHNKFTTENQTWKENPDLCCSVNKVLPLNSLKEKHQVWISGLIGQQNDFRNGRSIFEQTKEILKFHPIIDVSLDEVNKHIAKYNLPRNPLLSKGYGSVGCMHCTSKGEGRTGRWKTSTKTECGLHVQPKAVQMAV